MYHFCTSQTGSKSYVLAFKLFNKIWKKNLGHTSLIQSQHKKTVIWSKIYSDRKAQTWNHRRTQVTEMPTKCMYAILIDSSEEEKKRRPKFTISSKYREDADGMQHFTPMRTFHPFVWHPLWSKTICCYCLMQTHKTRKIVKTNKSKFWDLYPHSKITLIIWFLSFFVL